MDIGMTGVPIYNLSAGCSAGGHAFHMAYMLVASGQCDIALAMAGEKMPRGFIPLTGNEADPLDVQYLQFVCAGMTGPAFWRCWRAGGWEFGTTGADGQVAVKAHKNSVHNPNARYRKEFALEEAKLPP
jgi:acetyl-CoA acetyltransferase